MDVLNKLTEKDYCFIKANGFQDDDVIILEQEIEIMAAKQTKTKSEKVALEYKRQLDKVFTYIDFRMEQVENLDSIDFGKKAIILKELLKLKNRFIQNSNTI